MASLISRRRASSSHGPDIDWRGRSAREGAGRGSNGMLIAGLVIAGLGVLAWAYMGPDLRRYMKIHSM